MLPAGRRGLGRIPNQVGHMSARADERAVDIYADERNHLAILRPKC